MSLTMSMSAMHFFIERLFILKVVKSHLKGHMINRILHLTSKKLRLNMYNHSRSGLFLTVCKGWSNGETNF